MTPTAAPHFEVLPPAAVATATTPTGAPATSEAARDRRDVQKRGLHRLRAEILESLPAATDSRAVAKALDIAERGYRAGIEAQTDALTPELHQFIVALASAEERLARITRRAIRAEELTRHLAEKLRTRATAPVIAD